MKKIILISCTLRIMTYISQKCDYNLYELVFEWCRCYLHEIIKDTSLLLKSILQDWRLIWSDFNFASINFICSIISGSNISWWGLAKNKKMKKKLHRALYFNQSELRFIWIDQPQTRKIGACSTPFLNPHVESKHYICRYALCYAKSWPLHWRWQKISK